MEITADQFVTCRGRRGLTDDGQQGMDGKPGIGHSTEKTPGLAAAGIYAN